MKPHTPYSISSDAPYKAQAVPRGLSDQTDATATVVTEHKMTTWVTLVARASELRYYPANAPKFWQRRRANRLAIARLESDREKPTLQKPLKLRVLNDRSKSWPVSSRVVRQLRRSLAVAGFA